MRPCARLLLTGMLLTMVACTNVADPTDAALHPAADADVTALIRLGEQALAMAQIDLPGAILRQVDTDLTQTVFHFTDGAATAVTEIVVPTPEAPLDQWLVKRDLISPLVGHSKPNLNLQSVQVGPQQVAEAITAHWPGCTVRAITLYPDHERLTWTAFCNTPAGVVSGNMDAQLGVFEPSAAPPVSLPPTATPLP